MWEGGDIERSREREREKTNGQRIKVFLIFQGFPETTTVEAMSEAHRLKKDFQTRPTHRSPVNVDNFTQSMSPRDTGGWVLSVNKCSTLSLDQYKPK